MSVSRLIDSYKLEDEIAETSEIEDDDANHTDLVLSSSEESGSEEDENGNGNGDDS